MFESAEVGGKNIPAQSSHPLYGKGCSHWDHSIALQLGERGRGCGGAQSSGKIECSVSHSQSTQNKVVINNCPLPRTCNW
jgi:hypothetical protein